RAAALAEHPVHARRGFEFRQRILSGQQLQVFARDRRDAAEGRAVCLAALAAMADRDRTEFAVYFVTHGTAKATAGMHHRSPSCSTHGWIVMFRSYSTLRQIEIGTSPLGRAVTR